MIWLSEYRDFFMQNLLRIGYEKILLLASVNLWGDYPTCESSLLAPLPLAGGAGGGYWVWHGVAETCQRKDPSQPPPPEGGLKCNQCSGCTRMCLRQSRNSGFDRAADEDTYERISKPIDSPLYGPIIDTN